MTHIEQVNFNEQSIATIARDGGHGKQWREMASVLTFFGKLELQKQDDIEELVSTMNELSEIHYSNSGDFL